MKLRCFACKGPFGLKRRYFRGRAFCCRRCEDAWKFGQYNGTLPDLHGDLIAALHHPWVANR